MAAIDKTYVHTWAQYEMVKDWCIGKSFTLKDGTVIRPINYLYNHWNEEEITEQSEKDPNFEFPIWNTPTYLDIWLIKNCPIPFIQDRLKQQYGSEIEDIKNGISEYDEFKRNGLGKKLRFSVIKKPDFNIRFTPRKKGIHSWWSVDIYKECVEENGYEWKDNWWYNEDLDRWTCTTELCTFTTSCAYIKHFNLKKLLRKLRKWDLPAGLTIYIQGPWVGQRYIIKTK